MHTDFTSYLGNEIHGDFTLSPVSEDELSCVMHGLKNTSAGIDGIRTSLIKLVVNDILASLCFLLNLSFSKGVFPSACKHAKVIPVFKNGDPNIRANYRPISILPTLSKIFEKIVANRMFNHLEIENIISPNQFGFRPNHSTQHAVYSLYEQLAIAKENKKFSVTVFLDLSKAFDTVDHDVLLTKFGHYGFRHVTNAWFKSYLSDRTQRVAFRDECRCPECNKIPECNNYYIPGSSAARNEIHVTCRYAALHNEGRHCSLVKIQWLHSTYVLNWLCNHQKSIRKICFNKFSKKIKNGGGHVCLINVKNIIRCSGPPPPPPPRKKSASKAKVC